MDMTDPAKWLEEFNRIMKENDNLYRNAAKTLGLTDCTFWILYALREENSVLTQSEICNLMYQPKQTVNSALKKMELEGYIALRSHNNRRSKQIHLTDRGIALAEKTVNKMIAVEQEALSDLSDSERKIFISLFQKYTNLLKSRIQTLNDSGQKEAVPSSVPGETQQK